MARPSKNNDKNTPAAEEKAQDISASKGNDRLTALEAQLKQLTEQNQHLMAALIGQREQTQEKDEVLYNVTNVSGSALTAILQDDRGHDRMYQWDTRDKVVKMSAEQLKQLQEKSPHWFAEGYISAPEFVKDGPNVIRDLDEFVDTCTSENVSSRIEQITSIDTLYSLFHHIENLRFANEAEKDEHGYQVLKSVELPPMVLALQSMVMKKLNRLANVNTTMET